MKATLKIEFGEPEHGWLPVALMHGDFELKFEASDVPINPIDQLISGIRQISKGVDSEVWWHLEPAGYFFNFTQADDQYNLRISFAESYRADRELVYETQGNYEELILPFYRSIKIFFTRTIEFPHWPETDKNQIRTLTEIVKGT
jgi:hypothetical protein